MSNLVKFKKKLWNFGKFCQIWSNLKKKLWNLVEILVNFVKFGRNFVKFSQNFVKFWSNFVNFVEMWSNLNKKMWNLVKILIFFWQNPVSGPHKRHDGGWNCLIIQQKNVKYRQIWSNIVENLVKNQAFFREIYSKISKKAFFQPKFWYFFGKIQFQVHLNATMADENA